CSALQLLQTNASGRGWEKVMLRTLQVIVCASLIAMAPSALTQTTTSTVRGRVTGEHDRGLPGAAIEAVSTATGFVMAVKTGPDGWFQLSGLTPGDLTLKVSAQGYEPRS